MSIVGLAINWGAVLAWVANAEVNWFALIGMMVTCLWYVSFFLRRENNGGTMTLVILTAGQSITTPFTRWWIEKTT